MCVRRERPTKCPVTENGMRTFTREYVRPLGPSGFGGAAGGAAAGGGGAFGGSVGRPGGSVGRPGGSVGRLGGSVGRAAAVTLPERHWVPYAVFCRSCTMHTKCK